MRSATRVISAMELIFAVWIVGMSRAGASFLASRRAGDQGVSTGLAAGIHLKIMRSLDLAASIARTASERGRGRGERDKDKDAAEGEAQKQDGGNERARRLRRQWEFHAYNKIVCHRCVVGIAFAHPEGQTPSEIARQRGAHMGNPASTNFLAVSLPSRPWAAQQPLGNFSRTNRAPVRYEKNCAGKFRPPGAGSPPHLETQLGNLFGVSEPRGRPGRPRDGPGRHNSPPGSFEGPNRGPFGP